MRRGILAPALLAAGLCCACAKPAREPALLPPNLAIDAEVLELVAQKVALVRAAPADARAHADLGLAYEANLLWDAADRSFANALALDDSKPIWMLHRAIAQREAGQLEPSLQLMREAARRAPGDPAVQQHLGQWLLEVGDPEGARAAFERALAAKPDQPGFLTGLACVELAHERWNEALTLAKRALKGAPGYGPALFAQGQALQGLGRLDEAKGPLAAGLNSKVKWYPEELTRDFQSYRRATSTLAAEAGAASAAGDPARAVELYEQLLLRKPEDPNLLGNLGGSLVELGRLERAADVLAKALALAPDSFGVQLNLSELYLRQQRLPEALRAATRAVELGAQDGRAHHQLGRVLVLQQDLEGGARELEAAVALDVRDVRIYLELTATASRRGRLEEARGWCRKALALDPNSLPGRESQGSLALSAGDLDEARAALAALQRIAPQDPRTSALRARLQKGGR
jgi:tetratricopeptide (TPR) repeat protein